MGLDAKSSKHASPTEKPEVRTLYKLYTDVELHHRRRHRQIDDRDTDDFAKGVKKLREGALQTSISKTLFERQVQRTDNVPAETSGAVEPSSGGGDGESDSETSTASSESESESDEDSEDEGEINFATRGSTYMVNGELIFDGRDMMTGPEDLDKFAGLVDTPSEDEDAGAEDDSGIYEEPGGSEDSEHE